MKVTSWGVGCQFISQRNIVQAITEVGPTGTTSYFLSPIGWVGGAEIRHWLDHGEIKPWNGLFGLTWTVGFLDNAHEGHPEYGQFVPVKRDA